MPLLVSLLNPSILILCSIGHAQPWLGPNGIGSWKEWTKRTSPKWINWNERIPLGHINFPTSLKVPLAFPSKNQLGCEIVIPMDDSDGDDDFIFDIVLDPPNCPKEAGTLPDDDVLWINPDNWVPTISGTVNLAVPHVERIPCHYDTARFPNDLGNFFVVLPNQKISIRTLVYEGSVMNRFNFKSNPKSKEVFLKHFVVHGEQDVFSLVNFTGGECSDRTGCVCNTMQFYNEICRIMKPKCNQTLPCSHPIQPVGHCCPMCGAYLEMFFDPDRFVYQKFYSSALKKLVDLSFKHHYHISKISDRSIHVVIVMDEFEHNDNEVFLLTSDFADSLKNIEHLGILDFNLLSSGSFYDPHTWRKLLHRSLYLVVGVALIIGAYFLSKLRNKTRIYSVFSPKSSEFVKLEDTTENNQQNSEGDKHEDISSNDSDSENMNSEEKSDSDVFIELQATNEFEETSSLLFKESEEPEEIGVLLDFNDSLSEAKL